MSTYNELVSRAEAAAQSAAISEKNVSDNKVLVEGMVSQMESALTPTALSDISISVNAGTGVISANCSASSGYVSSATSKTAELNISGVAGTNLVAGNIKSGVTILGVTGSYEGDGGGGIDTNDANATSNQILVGASAYVSGTLISGGIQTVSATSLENVVTVPSGYIESAQVIEVGVSKGAETYTPGSAAQIISAGTYLGGSQTILGDANLVGENIKAGTSIFGVSGSYSASAEVNYDDVLQPTLVYDPDTNYVTVEVLTSGGDFVTEVLTDPGSFLPPISGTTYTPTTSSQIISSHQWIEHNDIVIAGDPNLVAGNIRSGVSIFDVTGSYAGGGNSNSGFDCFAVEQYTPYRAAFSAPTSIIVSGLSSFGNPDEWTQDISMYNGTYEVTSATQDKEGLERIYKNTSGNLYLVGHDPLDEWDETPTGWYFQSSTNTPYISACACYHEGAEIPNSEAYWSNAEFWESQVASTAVSTVTYPTQPLVLSGKQVTEYVADRRAWSFDSSASNLSSFDKTPVIGKVYLKSGTRLVGSPIDEYTVAAAERTVDENTLLYLPFGSGKLVDRSPYNHQILMQTFDSSVPQGYNDLISKSDLYTASELPGGRSLNEFSSVTWYVGGTEYINGGNIVLPNSGFLNRWNFRGWSYLEVTPLDTEFNFKDNDFTFEAYIYLDMDALDALGGNKYSYPRIYSHSTAPTMYGLIVDNIDNGVGRLVYYGSGTTNNIAIYNKTWYHVAQVRYGNTMMLFLDGLLVDSKEYTQSIGDNVGPIRIGSGPDNDGWPWWGKMADVRISNVARYTSNFTPLTRCVYALS